MYKKKQGQFNSSRFRPPQTWRKPVVLLSSLCINLLALALPMVILQIYDRIIPNQAADTFLVLMAGLVVVILIDTMLKIFRSVMLGWEGARFDHRQSLQAMDHILEAESLVFDEKPAGYYLDKMHALEQIQEFYSSQSMLLMVDFPFVVLFLALIWVIAGPLVVIPVGLLGLFLIVSFITGRNLQRALETRGIMEDRRQNFIIEALQGIHTIKSMAMESLMQRRYERLQHQSAKSIYELSRINSIVQGIGATFSQMAVVVFVGIGSLSVLSGDLTMGALAAGTMLSSRVLQPGLRAMGFWTQFQSVRLAIKKIKELFALAKEKKGGFRNEAGLRGEIELDHVSFKYPGQEWMLLDSVSLQIKGGEAVGITGNNGAGKSTLIGLMSGFLQPVKGQILLDGRDLKEYDLELVRAQIGIAPQHGILFEGTILENMTLYREGDAVEQAIELAQALGLSEIIATLPDGLDTRIGGAAVDTLSEGVRQKIVMVRSLVGHPSIMLFDDANANFDIKNDSKLLAMVKRFKGKRTLVIVSHRPSFLRVCDRQFVLQDGQLLEKKDETGQSQSPREPLQGMAGRSA